MDPDSQPDLWARVAAAVRRLRGDIRWKPGKDTVPLRTRQDYGHLPISATLQEYEAIIATVLADDDAEVYVYQWRDGTLYPTVVAMYAARPWLVMFSLDGVMETAFPPREPERYLADARFQRLGTLKELCE